MTKSTAGVSSLPTSVSSCSTAHKSPQYASGVICPWLCHMIYLGDWRNQFALAIAKCAGKGSGMSALCGSDAITHTDRVIRHVEAHFRHVAIDVRASVPPSSHRVCRFYTSARRKGSSRPPTSRPATTSACVSPLRGIELWSPWNTFTGP